jgi:hypothetical protein
LDWSTKRLPRAVPVLPTDPGLPDPNARGGRRGGKGIEVLGDVVVCASYDSLRLYDRDLGCRRVVTNGLTVGLHEVQAADHGSVWVAATAIDAVLRVELATGHVVQEFWPREMRGFQRSLGLTPLDIDKTADNRYRFLAETHTKHPSHLHLNAVASWRGETYALLSAFGSIVNLDREEVLVQDPALRGGHNLVIRDDGTTFVNHTARHTVRIYDLSARRLIRTIDVTRFPWVRALVRRTRLLEFPRQVLRKVGGWPAPGARLLFMRGLSLRDHLLFVGLAPAAVLCLDWPSGRLVDAFNYSRNVRVAVHGLKAVPAP